MTRTVTVVDYGIGNLLSVTRAVERCGGRPVLSGDPKAVAAAETLILPGVGGVRGRHGRAAPTRLD